MLNKVSYILSVSHLVFMFSPCPCQNILEIFDAVEAQNAKSMLQSTVGQVAFYGS